MISKTVLGKRKYEELEEVMEAAKKFTEEAPKDLKAHNLNAAKKSRDTETLIGAQTEEDLGPLYPCPCQPSSNLKLANQLVVGSKDNPITGNKFKDTNPS